jgi:FKBP-type peptidyl-prolyl cis-trans isomerase
MPKNKASILLSGMLLALVLLSATGCEPKTAAAPGEQAEGQSVESVALAAKEKSGGASLQIEEVKAGEGEEAKAGDTVAVSYVGTLVENGKEFDNSYKRGEPIRFKLGARQVIAGWDEGIQGMKPGGKRVLTIPPEKAYGKTGYPPVIPPNSALRFEVELVEIE